MNNYEKAVNELAPCGNDCSRCAYYEKGNIVQMSKELKESLSGFENMAQKIKDFMPIFENYENFLAILEHLSKGNCPGCRFSDKPACQCSVNGCCKKEGVNFCFECSKYPCTPEMYNEGLIKTWKKNNDSMRKVGIDKFYMEQKSKPRY